MQTVTDKVYYKLEENLYNDLDKCAPTEDIDKQLIFFFTRIVRSIRFVVRRHVSDDIGL